MQRLLAIVIVVSLFLTLTYVDSATVNAKQYREYKPPIATLWSPAPNATYNKSELLLNVTIEVFSGIYHNADRVQWLTYSVDGQPQVNMSLFRDTGRPVHLPYYTYANDVLTNLTEGQHNVTLYWRAGIVEPEYFQQTTLFTVDYAFVPTPTPSPIAVPLPATALWAAVASAIAIVSGVALLFLIRKRNLKKRLNQQATCPKRR